MTAPKIRVYGDPVLSTPAASVTVFDKQTATLVDTMFASLAVAEGVGLAAPQIGVGLAVFVFDCPDGRGARARGHVINPTIEVGTDTEVDEEGCLSVPGPYQELARARYAVVRGLDAHGDSVEVEGDGYLARCLQHEVDHLRGLLYVDHLPRNRRRRVVRDMHPFDWNEIGVTP